MKRLVLIAAAASVVLAGCSVSPGEKVDITMKEWSISVSPSSVTAGRVRLAVDSVGRETHELALILAKNPADLPRTPEGKLDLVANRPIDELEPFEPGHYIATSPNLPAGEYLVICTRRSIVNGVEVEHLAQGMVAHLTVNPRKKKVGN